jgi:hypothetical protein
MITIVKILLIPLFMGVQGYAIMKLWLWFMTPLGLPVIGLWHAVGIKGTVGYLARNWQPLPADWVGKDDEGAGLVMTLAEEFGVPLFVLVFGYVVHWLMLS